MLSFVDLPGQAEVATWDILSLGQAVQHDNSNNRQIRWSTSFLKVQSATSQASSFSKTRISRNNLVGLK